MKLSNFSKLSFGIGALGKDLCYAIISYFLMIYFTDTIGLTPLFVGNLFLVARVWDAFNDPMMGFVVDNTRTKWGKFRPWILIGTVLNAIVFSIYVYKTFRIRRNWHVYIFLCCLYFVGNDLYSYGYSILVNASVSFQHEKRKRFYVSYPENFCKYSLASYGCVCSETCICSW